MTPLLARSSLRFYLRHPWLGWLSVIGVALGVAVVVAVDLAAGSARTSFVRSVELLGGGASHRVVAAHQGIDERDYVALQKRFAGRVTPVVEGLLELITR